MTAADRIDAEVARLDAILAKRGAFYEDEKHQHIAYSNAAKWLKEDKAEAERIELEAMEAELAEEEERKRNDPNQKTRELFRGVKIAVPSRKG